MNELGLDRKLTNTFVLYKCPQLSGWFHFIAQLGFFCPDHLKVEFKAALFSGMLAFILCLIYYWLFLFPNSHNLQYVNFLILNKGSFKISNILML